MIRPGLYISLQFPARWTTSPDLLSYFIESLRDTGIVGLRLCGPRMIETARRMDVREFQIIGITKIRNPILKITPSASDVIDLINAGADIVATSESDVLGRLSVPFPMMFDGWDLPSIDDAVRNGFDNVATTLSGYRGEIPSSEPIHPDLSLVREIRNMFPHVDIMAEGRYRTREQIGIAMQFGAKAVTIGRSITDPKHILKGIV